MNVNLIKDRVLAVTLNPETNVISVNLETRQFDVTLERSVVQVFTEGNAGQPTTFSEIAAEPISGGRLLRLAVDGIRYYDASLAYNAFTLVGVSLHAADVGTSVTVQFAGAINHIGWGLSPNKPYFAGVNGVLSLYNPNLPFSQLIGRAIDSDTLIYQPQTVLFL